MVEMSVDNHKLAARGTVAHHSPKGEPWVGTVPTFRANHFGRVGKGKAALLNHFHGIAPIENGIHAVGGAHFAVGWHQAEQRAVLSAHQLLRSHHIDLPRSNKFGNAMPAVVPVVAWVVLRHLAAHVERGYSDLGYCPMACHVVLASAGAARKQHHSAN